MQQWTEKKGMGLHQLEKQDKNWQKWSVYSPDPNDPNTKKTDTDENKPNLNRFFSSNVLTIDPPMEIQNITMKYPRAKWEETSTFVDGKKMLQNFWKT